MEKKQEASLNRHRAVSAFIDREWSTITPSPALNRIRTGYQQTVTDIIANSEVQVSTDTGAANDKAAAKMAAAGAVAEVAGILSVLFKETGDATNGAKVKYSYSKLLLTKDGVLPQLCRDILAVAEAHKVAAADYGLTTEMLAGAAAATALYDSKAPTVKAARSKKKVVTATLEDLFSQASQQLQSMTKLLKPLEKTKPLFYKEFMATNTIDDAAVRKPADEGKLK